ncbi:MAG: hypothetical protein ACREVE_05420 [Gammaproteobacteria bacterium]
MLAETSLTASTAGKNTRHDLKALLETGAITRVRVGNGMRYRIVDHEAVRGVLARHFPDLGADVNAPARATAISMYRDAKRGVAGRRLLIYLRAIRKAVWSNGHALLDVFEHTRRFGVSALLLTPDDNWRTEQPLALIENSEPFLYLDRLYRNTDFDSAIYYAGWTSHAIIDWLANHHRAPRILYYADFDPVGLSNFLNLHQALGAQIELVVPRDFEALLVRYGKAQLLTKNLDKMPRLRNCEIGVVRRIAELLQKHGLGLEHEILLRNDLDFGATLTKFGGTCGSERD